MPSRGNDDLFVQVFEKNSDKVLVYFKIKNLDLKKNFPSEK